MQGNEFNTELETNYQTVKNKFTFHFLNIIFYFYVVQQFNLTCKKKI